jgi:hypothetical protein
MMSMDKTALKRAYKENPPAAGLFQITNTQNGKIFIGKGMNVQGILNSQRAQLQFGSHRNPDLQRDYNHDGVEAFDFKVLDHLEMSGNKTAGEIREDLAALEALWLEKLQPYGDRGYHKFPQAKHENR